MKKYFAILALAVMALVSSCAQEDKMDTKPEKPEAEQAKGLVFSASTDEAKTKTALQKDGDNYNVVWKSGDKITIVDNAGKAGVYTTSDNGVHADFVYESGDEVSAQPFKAYYPENLYSEGTAALPAIQNYAADNICQYPMYTESGSTSLKFKNLCGIIRLNAKTSMSSQRVRRIMLSADQGMSGTITNASTLLTNPTATVTAGKGVSLECGEEGVEIGSTAIPFHIAVPEDNYTGLKITVWTTEGLTQTLTLKTGKQAEVVRSCITTLNLSFNNLVSNTIDITGLDAITIPAGTFATLTGTNTNCVVTVEDRATVTLSDVSIGNFIIEAEATMILEGANTVNKGSTFITLRDNSTLTVKGTGTLAGNDYMGVGGNGDLAVEGGTLTFRGRDVDSGSGTAAISVRNFTVKDGTVNASGGANWYYGDNPYNGITCTGNISIEGGSVVCDGSHGLQADGNISISGGTVDATGRGEYQRFNSGISAAGTIAISGGTVTARGASTGSCPGIGDKGTCGDIIISGGKVTAFGGGTAAAIGAGGTCGNITITGGEVTATGGTGAAGIGTGSNANSKCGNIEISGGKVSAFGGDAASAIGTGNVSSAVCGDITLRNSIELIVARGGDGTTEHVGHGHASSTVGTITIESGVDVHNDYLRIDLSQTASANCYIVPAEGHYKFKATIKGNGASDLADISKNTSESDIASAALVWASFGTATAPLEGQMIKDIRYEDGYVLFSTGRPYVTGNAVVAIKNSSNQILWSWHLWFTDANIDGLAQVYPSGAQMMDRNLGALSATYTSGSTADWGLMYQWGRKDPFLNSKHDTFSAGYSTSATYHRPAVLGTTESFTQGYNQANSSVAATVKNPEKLYTGWYISSTNRSSKTWAYDMTDDLWAEDKTIFDPCPPGWQVPDRYAWGGSFIENLANAELQNNAYNVSGIIYPNTAVRLSSALYNSYNNKYTNGGLIIENVQEYHVFQWAFNGQLHKEKYQYTDILTGISVVNPDYGSVPEDLSLYYPTRAGAVRCVREGTKITHPTGLSITKTVNGNEVAIDKDIVITDSTLQLHASFIPSSAIGTNVVWSSSNTSRATVSSTGLITGVSKGFVTITATDGEHSCSIDLYVKKWATDMGLDLKFANCNLGASSPSEAGTYFSWGETSGKSSYAASTYKFGTYSTTSGNLTKYVSHSGWGTVDNLVELQNEDDAAIVILGEGDTRNWRLPTQEEWEKLMTNSYFTWTVETFGGVTGYKVYSDFSADFIFLPFSGYMNGNEPESCYYWTKNRDSNTSYKAIGAKISGNSNGAPASKGTYAFDRFFGMPIRPMYLSYGLE
ncbi:MAG: Ig-like domain-containing protein [Bacteroidales bacterium]|nr:Ig-like domain-containing protein [Bacteroidales bacterium]